MKSEAPLTILIIAILLMMVLPLPTIIVDTMIGINLSIAFLLIVIALHLHSPLSLSSFPAILLVTTLFRLALSISTTRLILLNGDAGYIVETFGHFVVGGNMVVGLTVFLILTIVQFIVVTKGAERVAEVSARFSLDALPGKQMAIDGDMRAAIIDGEEAGRRREALGRESQFYGAMDGAMKFVKGDAIAGIVIVLVNLIGGIAIGIAQRGMTFSNATAAYSVLTIGDGLVSQIPSLLISIAAGVVVTRVSSSSASSSAGRDISMQMMANSKAVAITGAGITAFGFVPGMPLIIFLILGVGMMLSAFFSMQAEKLKEKKINVRHSVSTENSEKSKKTAGSAAALSFSFPIEVQISHSYLTENSLHHIEEKLLEVKNGIATRLGIPLPNLKVQEISGEEIQVGYKILLHEVPVAHGMAGDNVALVIPDTFDKFSHLEILFEEIKIEGFGRRLAWVEKNDALHLENLGDTVYKDIDIIIFHFENLMIARASSFIGIQEAHDLLKLLELTYPDLVQEIHRLLPEQRLAEILQRLAAEQVSLRNLRAITESLVQWAPREKDIVVLTEYARLALGAQITHQWAGNEKILSAYLFAPDVEEMVRNAIRQTSGGNYLALDQTTSAEIVTAVGNILNENQYVVRTVILAPMEIRRYIRKVLEIDFPHIAVLAYQEVSADVQIEPLGRISFGENYRPTENNSMDKEYEDDEESENDENEKMLEY